ncbi:hypothetical protein LXA43DRAFT_563909 [Ganoderma leucocontextum]|nr:hypothetical protein LXA43DRAFT_563909 [Ganoderma leucocontextum]
MRDGSPDEKKEKRRRGRWQQSGIVGERPGPRAQWSGWERRTRLLFSPEAEPIAYLRTERERRCLGLSDYTQATPVLMIMACVTLAGCCMGRASKRWDYGGRTSGNAHTLADGMGQGRYSGTGHPRPAPGSRLDWGRTLRTLAMDARGGSPLASMRGERWPGEGASQDLCCGDCEEAGGGKRVRSRISRLGPCSCTRIGGLGLTSSPSVLTSPGSWCCQ